MQKLFSTITLSILTLFVIAGVLLLGIFYDWAGMLPIPQNWKTRAIHLATQLAPPTNTPTSTVTATFTPTPTFTATPTAAPSSTQTTQPTDTPLPTATSLPTDTATPVPTLEPQVYQAETISRLHDLAGALQRWVNTNQPLGQNQAMIHDPTWRAQMKAILADIRSTARTLAAVGPAPEADKDIHHWLVQVQQDASGLADAYAKAIQTADPADLLAASRQWNILKDDLAQAVGAMQAAGWSLQ